MLSVSRQGGIRRYFVGKRGMGNQRVIIVCVWVTQGASVSFIIILGGAFHPKKKKRRERRSARFLAILLLGSAGFFFGKRRAWVKEGISTHTHTSSYPGGMDERGLGILLL